MSSTTRGLDLHVSADAPRVRRLRGGGWTNQLVGPQFLTHVESCVFVLCVLKLRALELYDVFHYAPSWIGQGNGVRK